MQKKASTPASAKSAQKKPSPPAAPTPETGAKGAVKRSPTPAAKAPVAPTVGHKTAAKAPAAKKPAPDRAPAGKQAAADRAAKEPAKPAKEVSRTVVAKKAEQAVAKKAPAPKAKVKGERAAFLASQRKLLLEERSTYISSAEALKAQADSLALEHEPGDVQFDEEGGEGGTANVDREIDLYLSAQARATVVEIDRALQKIEDGTYGICENCGETIPDARLEALPYAALCVNCKSGGLSSRR